MYNDFINNIISSRGQWNIHDGCYFEGHHIIPQCLGGTGNPRKKDNNIIWLYPEEHYEAHRLLALEHPDNDSLVAAWSMMAMDSDSTNRTYNISKEDYAKMRKLLQENRGKKVICIETQKVYNSETEAYLKTGIWNIPECCSNNNGRNIAGGYHWAWLEDKKKQEELRRYINKEPKSATRAVICIETQEKFKSLAEVEKKYNINIRKYISGKSETAGGYHWAYLEDKEKQLELKKYIGKGKTDPYEKFKHKIICIETQVIYNSEEEIIKTLKYKNVMKCCNGIRKTVHGYHWAFLNDIDRQNKLKKFIGREPLSLSERFNPMAKKNREKCKIEG